MTQEGPRAWRGALRGGLDGLCFALLVLPLVAVWFVPAFLPFDRLGTTLAYFGAALFFFVHFGVVAGLVAHDFRAKRRKAAQKNRHAGTENWEEA